MKCLFPSLIFALVVMFSCDNASEETIQQDLLQQDTISNYGNRNVIFPKLTKNATTFLTEWGVFDDFEEEAKEINGSNIEDLRSRAERLYARTDSLSKKIPDTISSQAIVSRIMIAKTRAAILNQELNKSRLDSTKIENAISEMNIATINLIVQINEKFEKDAIDLQRKDSEKEELAKQQTFLDSVYQAELQDKRRDSL